MLENIIYVKLLWPTNFVWNIVVKACSVELGVTTLPGFRYFNCVCSLIFNEKLSEVKYGALSDLLEDEMQLTKSPIGLLTSRFAVKLNDFIFLTERFCKAAKEKDPKSQW
uniref:Uncharacterized protein n=1 Tax=Trichobilharzia regenti TaxID=157069 RepID=A0AA85JNK5_TRIRE|nr:unnamed protein product [Trichobilharzia regenti]